MSTDLPSSNPFRRRDPAQASPASQSLPVLHSALAHSLPPLDTTVSSSSSPARSVGKPVKKVRVQSPHSPEDESIPRKPPTPVPRAEKDVSRPRDPFELAGSNEWSGSEDEAEAEEYSSAPMNPFQKTLATLERTADDFKSTSPQTTLKAGTGVGKASLDVDAFKRLLLTGDAGVGAASSITASPQPIQGGQLAPQDGGSSTDASSISQQSMFEPLQQPHMESPRTSHDLSDLDDERKRLRSDSHGSTSDKKKPPPPNHKHGKLIRVELKDDALSRSHSNAASNAGSGVYQQHLEVTGSNLSLRSPTDLNKPLPTPPAPASYDTDRESIFDREAAGKTPEPPSPTYSTRRKIPPAPPLARRSSQLISDFKLTRTNSSSSKLASNREVENAGPMSDDVPAQPNSRPPPPPPTRRPQAIRQLSQTPSVSSLAPSISELERSAKAGPVPPPPPTRVSSGRQSGRPPSVSSMEMATKRQSTIPPPPPPRQRASSKNSMDAPLSSPASARASGEFRRSMDSGRRGSTTSHTTIPEVENVEAGSTRPANDILADISALQREIDALRGQAQQKRSVS